MPSCRGTKKRRKEGHDGGRTFLSIMAINLPSKETKTNRERIDSIKAPIVFFPTQQSAVVGIWPGERGDKPSQLLQKKTEKYFDQKLPSVSCSVREIIGSYDKRAHSIH